MKLNTVTPLAISLSRYLNKPWYNPPEHSSVINDDLGLSKDVLHPLIFDCVALIPPSAKISIKSSGCLVNPV